MKLDLFVPGRVCLFGEHSDWAGGYRRVDPRIEKGYTIVCGTDRGIHAEAEPHPASLVLTATTPDGEKRGPIEIPMTREALLAEAKGGGFWSYVAGVAFQTMTRYRVEGLALRNTRTDLPIRKGLSSSAAVCVLAARAFNRVYDLGLTTRGEMELAYQGEITTPSRCGRMDQACAFGGRPVLMTFDGEQVDVTEIGVAEDLHLVVVDLVAEKDTVRILERLNACYPWKDGAVAREVRALLGERNRGIVAEAAEAMRAADAARLGALMSEAQRLFDRYAVPACPEELTAPTLHRVLAHPAIAAHVWGGKGVGSQGDGSAQFVARSRADQRAAIDIIQRNLRMPAMAVTLRKAPATAKAPAAEQG